jgi:PAS domain S-box-containing protein
VEGAKRTEEPPHKDYRALFEYAPIGLGVADMDGRLLVFNHAIMQPGGYTRADIIAIGNVANLYCHAAERDRVLGIARERGFVWRHEVQFRRKDDSCYDTLLSLVPIHFDGRRCWLAAVEDISERKRAEEQQRQLEAQLRQAQKMEAVGRMTAGIAHDVNNILAVIVGSAELIVDTLGTDAVRVDEHISELRAAVARGAGMIQKLLGYSRQAALKVEPRDLAKLLDDIRGMIRHLVSDELKIEVSCVPESIAMVDATAVEQIVLNLVTNARDAMPRGGALRIEVTTVTVFDAETRPAWMTPGAFVRLSVSDTGVGMDEATRARVFEPFFTTKPAGAGTGLGLSMVYGLVKQQQGFVDVQSTPRSGTTVSVYFPRVASAAG